MFDDGTPLPSAKPTTGTGGTPSTASTSGTGTPVAPVRDYMKVANSIHREAAPAGLFKGKGKLIYDYLYSRTRGAVVPTRTVQASWREIMKAASIGSDKTLREQLKLLRAAGLVTWEWSEGSQGGSVYTVYLPEEATGTSGTPGTASTSGTSGQILPPVPPAESTAGTGSLNPSYQRTSDDPKTSFKTTTNTDDEGMPLLRARIGKAPKTEAVLLSLLDTLEARTDVSSPDALLAHVLTKKLAPRSNAAQRRPSDEQFRGGRVEIEVTAEDLAEYEKNRAELEGE